MTGGLAAASLSRVLGSLLFQVRAAGRIVLSTIPLVLSIAGALPGSWACRRAVQTHPALVLQCDCPPVSAARRGVFNV